MDIEFIVCMYERGILISASPVTGLLRGSYENSYATGFYKLNKSKVILLLHFKQNMLVPSSFALNCIYKYIYSIFNHSICFHLFRQQLIKSCLALNSFIYFQLDVYFHLDT